jgi:hypothetical protein
MLAQLEAMPAAVGEAVRKLSTRYRVLLAIGGSALMLGGCLPTTVPLAGADPADPSTKVAGVRYRSTVAPYTSLRPAQPLSWREQNDRAAPAPKSGQGGER